MRIVVRQISGLGNQLSQYVAGYYYAKRYGAQMELVTDADQKAFSHGFPRPFLLPKFMISSSFREITGYDRLILTERSVLKPILPAVRRIARTQVIRESVTDRYKFHCDLPVQSDSRKLYLVGYWQSYRYAEEIEADMRVELAFREAPEGRNLEVLKQISEAASPISLHIRRGDYTLQAEGNIALPMGYYRQAICFFQERFKDPTFFVFSDDINFARANLPGGIKIVYVDHNDSLAAHEDLRLMSACRHHVIANSTFSWWGAWLNARKDKMVFCPKYWHLHADSYFPDLLPADWIIADKEGA